MGYAERVVRDAAEGRPLPGPEHLKSGRQRRRRPSPPNTGASAVTQSTGLDDIRRLAAPETECVSSRVSDVERRADKLHAPFTEGLTSKAGGLLYQSERQGEIRRGIGFA